MRIKRFLIRATLFPITAVGALVALLAMMWLTLLLVPGVFLNDNTLKLAKWAAKKVDVDINWKEAHLVAESNSFAVKRIHLWLENFCYNSAPNKACFTNVDIYTDVSLNPFRVAVKKFGPGEILGGDIDWTVAASDDQESDTNYQDLLKQLHKIKIAPFRIEVSNWALRQPDSTQSGALLVLARKENLTSPWVLTLEASKLQGAPLKSLVVDGTVEGPEGQGLQQATIKARANAELNNNGRVSISVNLAPKDREHSDLNINANYAVAKQKLTANVTGELTKNHLRGELGVQTNNFASSGELISLYPCQYDLDFTQYDADVYSLEANCKGNLQRPDLADERKLSKLLPKQFFFALKSNNRLYTERNVTKFASTLALDLDPIQTPSLKYGGNMNGTFGGPIDAGADAIAVDVNFDVNAEIERFSALISQLRQTTWAIPAPLNVLEGQVRCGFSGKFATAKAKALLPIKCETNLKSQEQLLVTNADGVLEISTDGSARPALKLDANLAKVKMVLPDINITRPLPKVTRDRRITTQPLNTKPAAITYLVRVKSGEPVLLVTNLSDQPVPLNLDLFIASDKPLQGTIAMNNYTAELFRRKAKIDYLRLRYAPGVPSPELDGQVIVDTNDYRIRIITVGTMDRPRISLESEPPLPERDIMAVLLFGRLPEGLEPDQSRSADETRAAVADGAISLLSMYYLASTPIESMSYNPHTGMYSAKVSIAKGFSLTLGSNLETESQLGLRKRLGRNWTAESLAIKDEVNETTKGVAMFTWSKRY